jgi:hypothetical protein
MNDLGRVFRRLKALMQPYGEQLEVKADAAGEYYVDTRHAMKNKKPLFFGAVQIRKNYVAYHLMPVYTDPRLLDGVSAELTMRMHGKSCFNFERCDEALFRELAELTRAGFESYRKRGWV